MARSQPARSDFCATRHLLRNLANPRQLRRNPLARDAFERYGRESAALQIQFRVETALAAIPSQRSVAILLRVDVERHSANSVARDLGLSLRQYHRERRSAHDEFIRAFRSARPHQVAVVDEGFTARELRHASSLADSGEVSSARAILEDVVRSGGDCRCEALVRLANIESWSHRFREARELLRASERLLDEGPASRENRKLLDAKDAATFSLRAFAEGPELLKHADAQGHRTTLACADAALLSGDSSRAVKLLGRVPIAEAAYESAIDVLIMKAELANFTSPDSAFGEEMFAQAIALAQHEGMHGRSLYAMHHLYLTRWMHSRNPRDRASYRSLVDTVDPSLSPRLRMYLASSAADIELAIGSARRALRSAQLAQTLSTSRYEHLSAQALSAAALLKLGRLDEARQEAALAGEAARSANYPRIVSLAQRINAQALYARGSGRAAREAIEESVECARGHSSAYVLAQANNVRAGIVRAGSHNGAGGSHAIPSPVDV